MAVFFEIEIRDKDALAAFNTGRMTAAINKHAARQLLGFGTYIKNEIRRRVSSGSVTGPQLGNVQMAMKGDKRLLVHTGRFARSTNFKYKSEGGSVMGIEVGWLKGRSQRGLDYPKLAAIVENGREWKPSDAERAAVAIKARKAGLPKPEGSRKAIWRIPARPILTQILKDPKVERKFEEVGRIIINRAVEDVMGKK